LNQFYLFLLLHLSQMPVSRWYIHQWTLLHIITSSTYLIKNEYCSLARTRNKGESWQQVTTGLWAACSGWVVSCTQFCCPKLPHTRGFWSQAFTALSCQSVCGLECFGSSFSRFLISETWFVVSQFWTQKSCDPRQCVSCDSQDAPRWETFRSKTKAFETQLTLEYC
jgi:hypothetical protein